MAKPKPMDRLVVGDVGYGKTEIAIRAAFKAVMDNKQVAVLVPTTVLAEQHYLTFKQRMGAFPVKIEVLSRFRTPKEQKAVIEGLADGSVDICIGTHRLLQKDVVFKDLGLLVIDEEQRFGVSHKEYLKKTARAGRCAYPERYSYSPHPPHVPGGSQGYERHRNSAGKPPADQDLCRRI